MKIKKFGLIGLIICIVIGIIFFFPQNNQKETKKIKKGLLKMQSFFTR